MAILDILQYPDSHLKRKAVLVEDVKDPKVSKVIDDMLETLANASNCLALASTQLDIEPPPSITVINDPDDFGVLCFINPEIIESSGEDIDFEGCMSVCPGYIQAKVARPKKVTVSAIDRKGNDVKISCDGLLARCLQHEIDHLNGIVYLDRLSPLRRKFINKKINKILRR